MANDEDGQACAGGGILGQVEVCRDLEAELAGEGDGLRGDAVAGVEVVRAGGDGRQGGGLGEGNVGEGGRGQKQEFFSWGFSFREGFVKGFDWTGGDAGHDGAGGDIARDDGTGGDDGTIADGHAGKNARTRANPDVSGVRNLPLILAVMRCASALSLCMVSWTGEPAVIRAPESIAARKAVSSSLLTLLFMPLL